MAASPSIPSDPVELKRLSELRSALLDGIKKCGEVAFSVANLTLRKTILALENQSSQYLNEINRQIEILGGKAQDISLQQNLSLHITRGKKNENNNVTRQALKICNKIENSVIHLYGKMLKEPFENNHLQQLIRYQMDGIMRTTLQLKLLSKFLHSQ
jgi:hypothetical protein